MSDIYSQLGVQKIINATGTFTVLGGSRMSDKTLEDMKTAASNFVQIKDLQKKINAEVARLTHNEAAYITNGAAAGLYLCTCAAIQIKNGKSRHFYITKEEIEKRNVVVFKSHRNPYDFTISQAGAQYKEMGYPNFILPCTCEDLEEAIDENTCMVYYVHAVWTPDGALDLENTIRIAHERGIPVIVDAAAQLPPLENLWKFTEMGADAVLFSGGKDIRGPQSSGLVVGKKSFIDVVASLGFPIYGVGRMLKVGREEQVGLYSALKQYVEMDHEKRAQWCEGEVQKVIDGLAGTKHFKAERSFPNEAGQPIARAIVYVDGADADKIHDMLMEFNPGVYVMTEGTGAFYVNPMTMYEGDAEYVIKCLCEIDNNIGVL